MLPSPLLRGWTAFVFLLIVVSMLSIARQRISATQAPTASPLQYRAELVPSGQPGDRASTLEAVLNRYAAEGYELFDIDRDASGGTLVVFQRIDH